MLLLTLVACLLCGSLGVRAARPFVLAARLRAKNDDLERTLRSLRIQNQRDEKELKALDTPEGVSTAARKLGYILPNERKLRIPASHL